MFGTILATPNTRAADSVVTSILLRQQPGLPVAPLHDDVMGRVKDPPQKKPDANDLRAMIVSSPRRACLCLKVLRF